MLKTTKPPKRSGEVKTGLRLVWRTGSVPVRRAWETGLAVDAETAHRLPGLVQLFRGSEFLGVALIASEGVVEDEHRFRFKRRTLSSAAPPRDYAAGDDVMRLVPLSVDRARPGL